MKTKSDDWVLEGQDEDDERAHLEHFENALYNHRINSESQNNLSLHPRFNLSVAIKPRATLVSKEQTFDYQPQVARSINDYHQFTRAKPKQISDLDDGGEVTTK